MTSPYGWLIYEPWRHFTNDSYMNHDVTLRWFIYEPWRHFTDDSYMNHDVTLRMTHIWTITSFLEIFNDSWTIYVCLTIRNSWSLGSDFIVSVSINIVYVLLRTDSGERHEAGLRIHEVVAEWTRIEILIFNGKVNENGFLFPELNLRR